MRIHTMLVADTAATRKSVADCKPLQSAGYNITDVLGCYRGVQEKSFKLQTTSFHLLVGVAASIVSDRHEKEVWLVDSHSTVWVVDILAGVLRCKNSETGLDYTVGSYI